MSSMSRFIGSIAPPPRSRAFGQLAVAAAVLGVISVPIVPIIFVIGMISAIGIPVAMAALLFPTVCLAVVLAYLIWRIFLFRFPAGVPLSFLGALVVMLLVPLAHNTLVRFDVWSLKTDDLARPVTPLNGNETLVVFKPRHVTDYCDEVCVDLLLSGQIASYAASRMPRGETVPAPNAKVLVHRIVQAQSCGKRRLYLRSEKYKKSKMGTAAHALAAAKTQGKCIQSTSSTLDQIESPRIVVLLDHKHLDHLESALFIDTLIRPSRAAVYERTDDGGLSLFNQDTRVSYSLLQPLLAYHLSMADIVNVKPKWWRKHITVEKLDTRDFLHRVLGAHFHYQ